MLKENGRVKRKLGGWKRRQVPEDQRLDPQVSEEVTGAKCS